MRPIWTRKNAEEAEASAFFNSLPREQRRKLAPLLDEYRRRGYCEALDEMARVEEELKNRVRRIADHDWPEP